MTLFLVTRHISGPLCSGCCPTPLSSPLVMLHLAFTRAHTCVHSFPLTGIWVVHVCTRTTSVPPVPFPILGTSLRFTSVTGLPCCEPSSDPQVPETEATVDVFLARDIAWPRAEQMAVTWCSP